MILADARISLFLMLPLQLQISEVVNSMKDLIDFCRESKVGPVGNILVPASSFFVGYWCCGGVDKYIVFL